MSPGSDRRGSRRSRLARKISRKARLPAAWLRSRRAAGRERFQDVSAFCLFVGYPRSGHSLIGALLDAHPDMIVAHELHVLRYLRYGFDRDQIFSLLLERSRQQAAAGREATGYSYRVPGQWQGRYRQLRVIGDKRGGGSIRKLCAHPHLLERLRRVVDVPLRFVHVLRNPFDNVASLYQRGRGRSLEACLDRYLAMLEGVAELRGRLAADELLDVRHEAFVADPRAELSRLCRFLSVEPGADYLDACAAIVWPEVQRRRDEICWPEPCRKRLEARIERHEVLEGYGFQ
jgi:hypothetical protein